MEFTTKIIITMFEKYQRFHFPPVISKIAIYKRKRLSIIIKEYTKGCNYNKNNNSNDSHESERK